MNYKRIWILALSIIACAMLNSCSSETAEKPKKQTKTEEKPISESDKTTASKAKNIVFFGNSLTAGLGVDPEDAFVGVIEKRIDSLELGYTVINAGISGETTAGGLSRINWILDQNKIDVFVLELGGNDGLRGIAPASSEQNLQQIIEAVKGKYPDVKILLAGMEAPPNMGADFTTAFKAMYPRLAKANEVALIPFLLDKVGGIPELNQPDGIHPTEEGHRIVADNIWEVLEPLL